MQQYNNNVIIDTNAQEVDSGGEKNEDTILGESLSIENN